MEDSLRELAAVLQERLAIVADEESRREPDRHMDRLRDVSIRLEAIEQRLPPTLDPQLKHFLQRRSYSKALDYLTSQPSAASRETT